jgi:hypothetical protein
MDDLVRVPGLGASFGLDAALGLIPGVGDTATTLVALYVLVAAVRYRVPKVTIARMALNVGIDYAAGAIPVVGDAFDVWWKANRRNLELLRRHGSSAAGGGRPPSLGDWLFVGAIGAALVALSVGSVAVAAYAASRLWRLAAGG